MESETSISILKAAVHILDTNLQMPVLSDSENPLDDDMTEFLERHIEKILKDDGLKAAQFKDEDNRMKELCTAVVFQPVDFLDISKEIAGTLFGIMLRYVEIPPADLVCCLIELDGIQHFGILKLNYRNSYIHLVQPAQDGNMNAIIKQRTALPGESQKVDECALINLTDLGIRLIEKKYEINGEKIFYLSSLFLNCTSQMSDKEKVKAFKKATDTFSKQVFEDDFGKAVDIRKAVVDSIERNNAIDVQEVVDNVFPGSPELKNNYIEYIENAGLKEKRIEISEKAAEKSFMRQKIKTDTGIEINLPIEYCSDNGKVEFINNPDGSISILIKNVGRITNG